MSSDCLDLHRKVEDAEIQRRCNEIRPLLERFRAYMESANEVRRELTEKFVELDELDAVRGDLTTLAAHEGLRRQFERICSAAGQES